MVVVVVVAVLLIRLGLSRRARINIVPRGGSACASRGGDATHARRRRRPRQPQVESAAPDSAPRTDAYVAAARVSLSLPTGRGGGRGNDNNGGLLNYAHGVAVA